jgi:hypothetical protein
MTSVAGPFHDFGEVICSTSSIIPNCQETFEPFNQTFRYLIAGEAEPGTLVRFCLGDDCINWNYMQPLLDFCYENLPEEISEWCPLILSVIALFEAEASPNGDFTAQLVTVTDMTEAEIGANTISTTGSESDCITYTLP